MTDAIALIDRLAQQHSLTLAEYQTLIEAECEETRTYAAQQAVAVRQADIDVVEVLALLRTQREIAAGQRG